MKFSGYDVKIMAKTLYGEARNQGWKGLVAVGEVILNRAKRPGWWGKDIASVCTAPYQFSCWNRNDPNRQILLDLDENDPTFLLCLAATYYVLSESDKQLTFGATNYHTIVAPKDAKVWPPSWTRDLTHTANVNDHIFYK